MSGPASSRASGYVHFVKPTAPLTSSHRKRLGAILVLRSTRSQTPMRSSDRRSFQNTLNGRPDFVASSCRQRIRQYIRILRIYKPPRAGLRRERNRSESFFSPPRSARESVGTQWNLSNLNSRSGERIFDTCGTAPVGMHPPPDAFRPNGVRGWRFTMGVRFAGRRGAVEADSQTTRSHGCSSSSMPVNACPFRAHAD